jgi:heme exporter protein D
MTHLGYILAAYLASAIVLFGMVAWVVLDLRTQKQKLARLEEQGLRRRSEVAR